MRAIPLFPALICSNLTVSGISRKYMYVLGCYTDKGCSCTPNDMSH